MISLLIYIFLIVSSLGILLYKNYKKDEFIRIEWDALAKFVGFMAIITMVRFCMADIAMMFSPETIESVTRSVQGIGVGSTLFVFWEDVWFVMPIAFIMRKIFPTHKKIATLLIVLISVIFGMGHLYQGYMAAVLALYPFFISYRYGKKYGLGTVMLCHMFYDFVTVMTVKNINLLL